MGTLESSLTASDGLGVRNPAGSAFVLPATTAVDQAIEDCWRSDVYLPALAPRFWRLTLQLLGRYRSWLDDVLPRQSSAPSKTVRSSHYVLTLTPQSTPALSRAGTPQPDGAHADDALLLRQLSVIVIDTTRLCASVLERFDGAIAALLPRGDADASEPEPTDAARSALLAMTTSLESVLPPLLAQIVGVLSRQSAEPLRSGLRSVTSEVRAGGAAAPTEPSHFVGRVLKPLRTFLDGAGRDMPTSSREQIAADVLDDMAGRSVVRSHGLALTLPAMHRSSIRCDRRKTHSVGSRRVGKASRSGRRPRARAARTRRPMSDGRSRSTSTRSARMRRRSAYRRTTPRAFGRCERRPRRMRRRRYEQLCNSSAMQRDLCVQPSDRARGDRCRHSFSGHAV